ncbi:PSP1 domain-containing protein [Sediminispirochaeta smaragdinae]|uniref:PSP1 domain protein n=1 Tax=Sediminispirochaeta smaragdinae (strain DSM 11293 / JCM 15392 / SEBR 4228) TaxID=573413 RepID=E1R5F7_SEDSS|nr:regulatory iron-sulfur-containing complex subunit RicT [Sediminispirochaeta smaragdinae]ADK82285.1 PSP1 domain protein [Sediminispirochaeta smaragdinae DSM 11293]
MSDNYIEEPLGAPEVDASASSIAEDNVSPVMVKFPYSSETVVCLADNAEVLSIGDMVLVPSRYGKDLAKVLGPVHCPGCSEDPPPKVLRKANDQDLATYEHNLEREREAFNICREKIHAHGLEMKLVAAHYLLDEPKVLFFFTAESRVDFRSLVKDLVSVFKMRIELRQIGVRDESRVLGGVAVCGRQFCCHGITDKLKPVSIKMAKEQNLSLNSMKISGPCGRLLCCLSYEYDFYREEKALVPSEGTRVRIGGETFKAIEVNILTKKIRFAGPEGRSVEVPFSRISRGENKEWHIDYDPDAED